MNELFSSLGLNSKTLVGISLSANNLLELICIDKATKAITSYASTQVQYNSAIREIVDQNEFVDGLQTLFTQVDLNPKACDVWLNLPNVHFGFSTMDQNVTEEEISEVLLSEVEDLYIFKKNDPMIEYQTIGRNQQTGELLVVYSAIQRKTVDFVKECFNDIGANLVAVETSNSSLLKGIQYSQFSRFDFSSTSILLITSNSYSIFYLNNNLLIDYYEEPLAIKSFSNEEVYSAIANAASTTLSKFNSQNLLVISETDEISAELLASQVVFNGNIEYIDRNKWTNGCFIEIKPDAAILQEQIPYISIEAVGIAATMYEDYMLSFSFVHDGKMQDYETINILGKDLNFVQYLVLVLATAIIIALIIILGIGGYYNNKASEVEQETSAITAKNDRMQTEINEAKQNKNKEDIFAVAQGIQNTNQNDFIMLNALSTDIPPTVWIEKFMLASDAFTTISGKALSSNEIDEFFRNLQQRDPSLSLTKLELNTEDANYVDGVYNFEMTNDSIASSAVENEMSNKSQEQAAPSDDSMTSGMGPDPMMNDAPPMPRF
ncbi:PilN domain-containing protein [bacterium]|nr:PilN domain-containing protein [bacterium]